MRPEANANGVEDAVVVVVGITRIAIAVAVGVLLAEVLDQVPVHVVPCITGRPDNLPNFGASGILGSILPAAWSFMLAARERGLGTAWTTLHLMFEEQAAEILGIPFAEVAQVALIPLAYSIGTDFKPAPRSDLSAITHWNSWNA